MTIEARKWYLKGYEQGKKDVINKLDDFLEQLSDLEHNQWWEWSRDLSRKEKLSKERLDRWDNLWTFYKFLPEKAKEQDRIYALKVVKLLKELMKE